MNSYDIMLEGREGQHGYFVSMKVVSIDQDSAIENCLKEAQEMGMDIVGVEEIEELEGDFSELEQVIEVSGRSYFTE